MKKTASKAIAILLTVACMTGFTACSSGMSGSKETEAEAENSDQTIEDTTADDSAGTAGASTSVFTEANLIKVGEHTYYPDYLFMSDRDKKFKDYIISVFEESDKDLHDDIFVYVIMEAETKGEFRFSAKVMMDGVILQEGEMMNWHSPEAGYVWQYDFSKFRRCDFNKNGIISADEAGQTVYKDAQANSTELYNGDDISGTYLLKADGQGNLYYEFTVNRFSTITVDARTGSIIQAHYWDGIYT